MCFLQRRLPVNSDGFAELDEKATTEVLDFYKKIAKASPPGELFWKQSRAVYFAGQAAMIIWSPFILDELAGLRDSAPPTINDDPTSSELASKTGIVTTFGGPSNSAGAAWADIRYFGVTSDANTEVALNLSLFYERWLYRNAIYCAGRKVSSAAGRSF